MTLFSSSLILSCVMVATILFDLRQMRIPNWLSLIGIGTFVLFLVWNLPAVEIYWRLGLASAALFAGFVLFAVNVMGAGDVKIFAVLMLFVPSNETATFMLIFAASLIAGIIVILLARKWLQSESSAWAFLRNEKRFPAGLSIGSAGLAQLLYL